MYRQNDEKLNPLSTWGCAFCSLFAMVEDVTGTVFWPKDILSLWLKNWQEDDIDVESTMNDWQGVLDDLPGRIQYLGHKPPEYETKPNEREILLFQRPDGFRHFVYGDGRGGVKWDPYENSRTVREGKIVSKRIFEIGG